MQHNFMTTDIDQMRFALVPPERCPLCQRKAAAVEASVRLAGMSYESAIRSGKMARCEGHKNV